jgi:hypothetical protein
MGFKRAGPEVDKRGKGWVVTCSSSTCHEFSVLCYTEKEANTVKRNHICRGTPKRKDGKW